MTSQPGFASCRATRPIPTEWEEPAVDSLAPRLPATQPAQDPEPQPPPLRSIHTSNFPAILQELGIALAVSTYQAGKLVLVRPEGDCLNTYFRGFHKPMGLAVSGDRLAVGRALARSRTRTASGASRPAAPLGSAVGARPGQQRGRAPVVRRRPTQHRRQCPRPAMAGRRPLFASLVSLALRVSVQPTLAHGYGSAHDTSRTRRHKEKRERMENLTLGSVRLPSGISMLLGPVRQTL
jgi:hypothetical protein